MKLATFENMAPVPTAEETAALAERLTGAWASAPVKKHQESPPVKPIVPSAPFPVPSPSLAPPPTVTLTLKPIGSQKPYTLSDCDPRSLILELKSRLQTEQGLDLKGQRWLLRGKGLENWRALGEYLVSDDGEVNKESEIMITLMYKAPVSTVASSVIAQTTTTTTSTTVEKVETDWKKELSSKAAFWTEISQILSKHVSDSSRVQEALLLFKAALV